MSGVRPAPGGPRAGTRPHPAVRDRRRAVAREQGRRRRSGALLLLGTAATIAILYWLVTGPVLMVSGVDVTGYDRDDRAELEAALTRAGETGTVLSPPTGEIALAASRFPWVESVRVHRSWPRGLSVAVRQATPVAVAAFGEDAVLVSASGRVLGELEGQAGTGWLRLAEAPPAPGATLPDDTVAMLSFLTAAEPEVAARVRALEIDRDGMVTGRLTRGPDLRLGPPVRMEAKARALSLVLANLSPQEEASASYVTLVAPGNPALGPAR